MNDSYWAGAIPWISAATLKRSRIDDSDQYLTEAGVRGGSKIAPVGAILVLVRGMALHRETRIGMATRPVGFNQDIKALIPSSGVLSDFLLYSLQARSMQILDLVSSAGNGTGVLNTQLLQRLEIWIPDEQAQRRIVVAIDAADSYVATLERLIAKKRAIKQGMMQQLLTGKVRLPGFTRLWREVALGELATIISGGTPKSSNRTYWNGDIPWCTPTDITGEPGRYLRQTERTISRQGLERSAAELLPAGSLLLCTRATIGEVKVAHFPVATNQGFKSLVPRAGVVGEFLYYKVLSLKGNLAAMGSGSTFLEVSGRDVASLELAVPEVDEQDAIATVMADADDEIDRLKRRLEKATATKAGMMQELLTGRTRLPAQKAAS
jgi:type I restriction enzyme S subunit